SKAWPSPEENRSRSGKERYWSVLSSCGRIDRGSTEEDPRLYSSPPNWCDQARKRKTTNNTNNTNKDTRRQGERWLVLLGWPFLSLFVLFVLFVVLRLIGQEPQWGEIGCHHPFAAVLSTA